MGTDDTFLTSILKVESGVRLHAGLLRGKSAVRKAALSLINITYKKESMAETSLAAGIKGNGHLPAVPGRIEQAEAQRAADG